MRKLRVFVVLASLVLLLNPSPAFAASEEVAFDLHASLVNGARTVWISLSYSCPDDRQAGKSVTTTLAIRAKQAKPPLEGVPAPLNTQDEGGWAYSGKLSCDGGAHRVSVGVTTSPAAMSSGTFDREHPISGLVRMEREISEDQGNFVEVHNENITDARIAAFTLTAPGSDEEADAENQYREGQRRQVTAICDRYLNDPASKNLRMQEKCRVLLGRG